MDGAEQPPVALYTIMLHGASKYFPPTNHCCGLNLVVMSRKLFDGTLSLAQQMAVLEAGKTTAQLAWNLSIARKRSSARSGRRACR